MFYAVFFFTTISKCWMSTCRRKCQGKSYWKRTTRTVRDIGSQTKVKIMCSEASFRWRIWRETVVNKGSNWKNLIELAMELKVWKLQE